MENLKTAAKKIQEKGTGGDTILAHINPQEAQLLKMMGGSGTINPETGLPEYKKFWKRITVKNIVKAAPIIIAVAAPGIGTAIGEAVASVVGATLTAAEAAAVGSAVIGGTITAAQGGNVEQVLKSAAAAGIGSAIGSTIGGVAADAGAPQAISGAVSGAASGATGAAITGGDIGKAATTGAITGGAVGGYRDITSTPPSLTTPTQEPATTDVTKPVDYSPAAGFTAPQQSPTMGLGQGIGGNIPPVPSGEQPIDYSSIFAPTTPSTGFQTQETRNLPSMGGGTGLTGTTETGAPVQVAPTEPSPLKQAGESATRYLAGQYASSLYDQKPSTSASTLTSTGLFSPTSIVPTALTGIAPVGRGKPILGGEDEEATGTWGAKTLRG